MNEVVEAAVAGASLAAGAAIWLLAGYLIQRFAFRNPEPTYAIVFATSLTASILLFSLLALLTFHIRYNYPGATSDWGSNGSLTPSWCQTGASS
jgi:hypothetical protein